MKYSSVRGTRDVFGQEASKISYVENLSRKIFAAYGYKEIYIPTFEQTDLFNRSIGETSDIVEKEMYTFNDKKGRSITLRPEGTAGVVRAFVEHNLAKDNSSVRLYYIGPMFRYERPQAGRYREFRQLGVELLGSSNPRSEIEIISIFVDFFRHLQLNDYCVYINNVGCQECRVRYKNIFTDSMKENIPDLCSDCQRRFVKNPFRVLDCKREQCRTHLKNIPLISEYLCPTCKKHLNDVKAYLSESDIQYQEDPYLVRGLDYYTGIVFEIKCKNLGAQNTLAAGGRYDSLVEEIGGASIPAVGAALGVERLLDIINFENIVLPLNESIDVFFVHLGEESLRKSVILAKDLRKGDITCQVDYDQKSLKAQLRYADKIKARFAVIIGDEEIKKGVVILKDMQNKNQEEIKEDGLKSKIENTKR